MPEPMLTANVKLIIVVGPFEVSEQLATDLRRLGVRGFTTMRVNGDGVHGPRHYGAIDSGNVRFEVLASKPLADKILAHVATTLADRAVTAYSMDVEAVPADHFD